MASYSSCLLISLLSMLSMTDAVDDCPPWFKLSNNSTHCVCRDTVNSVIICDQLNQQSFLPLGLCALHNSTTNNTVVGACPYVFPDHLIKNQLIPLPNKSSELNHFICGSVNRDIGTPLCGRCTNGTGPSIYSIGSQCARCSTVNIVYYLLLQYLPTTVLFVAIIVFRINITSAPMAHYVLFCNCIMMMFKSVTGAYINFYRATVHNNSVLIVTKLFLCLDSIWTLDFLYPLSPPLCVSEYIEEIYIPFLDTLAALYPFVLLLLTYVGIELHAHDCKLVVCLWRPIHRTYVRFQRSWNPNASMVQALATLFFLSYTKFILLMYEALFISVVINEDNKVVSRVSYIDPTVLIFKRKHWYLISLSGFILVFIILPPLTLLILYPTHVFRRVSRHLKPRWMASIQTFVDTFHGCYKDGTNGTRDYRAVSGYILVIWIFIPALFITVRTLAKINEPLPGVTFIILHTALTVACALLKPYKHRTANISGVALPAIYVIATSLTFLATNNAENNAKGLILLFLVLSLPHWVFYGYIVYRLGKLFKQYCCMAQDMEQLQCRPANTTGYSQLIQVSS